MDAARQIIRWSIPGFTFTFLLVLFQGVNELLWGDKLDVLSLQSATPSISGAIATLVVAAGIPLGFLLYQFYYASYGRVLPFDLVVTDRGAEILAHLPAKTVEEITRCTGCEPDFEEKMYYEVYVKIPVLRLFFRRPAYRLLPQYQTPEGRGRYTRKIQNNLNIVRAYLDHMSIQEKSNQIKQEYTSISDIYHSLGACRTALFMAFVTYIIYNLYFHQARQQQSLIWFLLVNLIIFIIAFVFFRVFERTRINTRLSAQAVLKFGLRWYAIRSEDDKSNSNSNDNSSSTEESS